MKDDTYRNEASPQPWIPCWGFLYHARRCDGATDKSGLSTWLTETNIHTKMGVTLTNIRNIERDLVMETGAKWAIISFSPPIWCDVDPARS
mgnify:CR=1 FL=1